MDLATIVGFIGGFVIVIAAMFAGGDIMIFVNIPSVLIVVGGTLFVVAMKFSGTQLAKAMSIAGKAFMVKVADRDELIGLLREMGTLARKDGPLALEKLQIDDPFLSRGVMMIVDGSEADVVRSILNKEKNNIKKRHDDGRRIFMSMGDVAPAMGMIGTLVGLVQMLSNMSDPKSIGPSMAVALLTTLYGAMIANMVALPIADKLSIRGDEEEKVQAMVVDALSAISTGAPRTVLDETLNSYVAVSQREEAA